MGTLTLDEVKGLEPGTRVTDRSGDEWTVAGCTTPAGLLSTPWGNGVLWEWDELQPLDYGPWVAEGVPVRPSVTIDVPDAEADGYAWPSLAQGSTIAHDAHEVVYGRGDNYGHPRDNHTRIAQLWTALLSEHLADGAYITPEDVARCMVAMKLARDVTHPKRDNRVDGIGYFIALDRMATGQ